MTLITKHKEDALYEDAQLGSTKKTHFREDAQLGITKRNDFLEDAGSSL